MASEVLKIDQNNKNVAGAVTDDSNQYIKMLRIDDTTKGLKVNVVGGIPIVAGSDTWVQYNHLGALGADNHFTFDYTNKQLMVGTGTYVLDGSDINPILLKTSGVNSYFASVVHNGSAGGSASSDITAGNDIDDGTAATGHYIDVGITSSGFNDPLYTINAANDGYLEMNGGNLNIGTGTTNKKIRFFTGGYLAANLVASFDTSGNFNIVGLTASQILATDASKNLVSLATATYPSLTELSYVKGVSSSIQTQLNSKGTGTITGSGNANEITYFTGSTAIGSLAVATYPNLTELSYVKGVTSAIQTQLNAKGAGTVTAIGVTTANGVSGSSSGGATPNLTITLGAITPTTVNGNTFTTGSSTYTGTAGQTYTFPSTSATIARIDAANTFTGASTATSWVFTTPLLGTPTSGVLTNCTGLPAASLVAGTLGSGTFTTTRLNYTNNAITASGNAATVPITSSLSTVTNNSAATLTITMATSSAVDGQMTIVRILDFSAVAQTLVFVNTENSTVTVPATSNGSTTLFLTVGFIYNGGTSKWRCIALA